MLADALKFSCNNNQFLFTALTPKQVSLKLVGFIFVGYIDWFPKTKIAVCASQSNVNKGGYILINVDNKCE